MALIAPNFDDIKDSTKSLVNQMVDSAENWAGVTTSTLASLASFISSNAPDVDFIPSTADFTYDADITINEPTCAEPSELTITSISPDASFTPATAPQSPDLSYDAPTVSFQEVPTVSAPSLPGAVVAPGLSPADGAISISAPSVDVSDITVLSPTAPSLPDTPGAVAAPSFSDFGTAPSFVAPVIPALEVIPVPDELVALYEYDEPSYTAKVSAEIQTVLQGILAGGLIIPTTVWDDIWDRTVGDIEQTFVGEEWAASELAASLGMTGLPSETLLSRWSVVTNKKAQAISKARLEQSITEAQQRREDLWQATKDGIAFETMWLRHHTELAGRALASALNAHQAKVAVYNANVAVYNARVQYASYAVAYGQLELQAALAPIQYYASALEAARIEVLQDDQVVKRWLAEWQGYTAEINGVTSIYQADVSKYSADIQKEKVGVDAAVAVGGIENQHNANLVSAYSASTGASNAYRQAQTELYKADVGYYSAAAQAAIGSANVEIASGELAAKNNSTLVSKFSAEVQLLQALLQNRVSVFQSEVNLMDAQNRGAKASADVAVANYQTQIQSQAQQISAFAATWRAISDQAQACATQLNAEINKAELSIKNESASLTAGIEAARLNLESTKTEAEIALQNARILLETSLSPIQAIATLQAGITQSYISAIDASMSLSAQSQQNAQFDVGEDAGGDSSFG